MRKIIVLTFLTLDGVMQAPGGPQEDTEGGFKYGGWVASLFDAALSEEMGKQMNRPADLLLGRKTFEIFAGYWPEHESGWPGINKMTKYVATKSLTKSNWENTVILKGDIVEEIKKLKRDKGLDLHVYGSGDLIQTLLKNDLVDELWLKIFPVTIGEGKRLFAEGTKPESFKLAESKTTPSGVIIANYKRAGKLKTGTAGS